MKFNEIKNQLLYSLSTDLLNYESLLENTSPGNYGHTGDWEVEINESQFYVNVAEKTVKFFDTSFSATVLLYGSNADDAVPTSFTVRINAEAKFDFIDSKTVEIQEIEFDKKTIYLLR